MTSHNMPALLANVTRCTLCAAHLPLAPKPIFQLSSRAKILIAGQAPGLITHHKGIPFDDASGKRLRDWLGVSDEQFYDPALFAIMPMGFCFPGSVVKQGKKQGDKPPRPECAATWHQQLLPQMPQIELTILLGQYAIDYHLPSNGMTQKPNVSQALATWQDYWPRYLVLPHPSPRNSHFLAKHPELTNTILPVLKARITAILTSHSAVKT